MREWFKVKGYKILHGALSMETRDQQLFWIKLLAQASLSSIPAVVCADSKTPFTDEKLGSLLGFKTEEIQPLLEHHIKKDRIKILSWGGIEVVNWFKEQDNSYDRVIKYRSKKAYETELKRKRNGIETKRNAIEENRIEIEEKRKEEDNTPPKPPLEALPQTVIMGDDVIYYYSKTISRKFPLIDADTGIPYKTKEEAIKAVDQSLDLPSSPFLMAIGEKHLKEWQERYAEINIRGKIIALARWLDKHISEASKYTNWHLFVSRNLAREYRNIQAQKAENEEGRRKE